MRIIIFLFFNLLISSEKSNAQSNKAINFQAIARTTNGLIVANKEISIRLSLKNDTTSDIIEYQEIKSATTNVLGLFTILLGAEERGKIVSIGDFTKINWTNNDKFLKIEIDPDGRLVFENLGIQKINYVPFSFYADNVTANNISGIISLSHGGTGVASIKELIYLLNIEKINNTPDSLKPISIYTMQALSEKLKKSDTLSISNRINLKLNIADTNKLSNRINLKLNTSDTVGLSKRIDLKLNAKDTSDLGDRIDLKLNKKDTTSLSNRINFKLNKADTISLSDRINQKINIDEITTMAILKGLGYVPARVAYGSFYDTAKQQATASVATAIKLYFTHLGNAISITNNTSGIPTRVTVKHAGVYSIQYTLQVIKSDTGAAEMSVWLRRNGSAYANTHTSYTIAGNSIKNILSASFLVELGDDDYIETYFSGKNSNSIISGTITQASPSRPATPPIRITIQRVD
jgi:hypothetical protein